MSRFSVVYIDSVWLEDPLGSQAVDVSGEEDGLFDVVEADSFLGQTVDSKTETAVGW